MQFDTQNHQVEHSTIKILLYYIRIKTAAQVGFSTNLPLMTNTATLNTSNKNANNCGKLKYILRRKQKLLLFKSSQHTKSAEVKTS